MATGRERREIEEAARARTEARRNEQTARPGGRHRAGEEGVRDFGLATPSHGGKGIDVNVVGNSQFLHDVSQLVSNTGGRQGRQSQHGDPRAQNSANITSGGGAKGVAKEIAQELKLAADAAAQLTKVTTTHIGETQKLYDRQKKAIEDLITSIERASTSTGTAPSTGGGPVNPQNPHVAPSGAGGGRRRGGGHGGMGGGFPWPGGFSGMPGSGNHYDPSGLLDSDAPIFGGPRNSYMAYMEHLAGGGSHDDFNPNSFMSRGRNHPTSYGEMKRRVRVGVGRAVNQRFGEPTMPQLKTHFDSQGNLSHYTYDAKDGSAERRLDPTADKSEIEGISEKLSTGFKGAKMASSLAGGFARAGITGALGDAIPGVGWAMAGADALNRGAEWVTEQRAANAPYQAIEGGGNLSTGFRERMAKFGNRMNERFSGGMTGEQSDQTFDTLTSARLTGTQRDGYMQYASQNYRQYGIDPQTTAQMVVDAANHANSGLVNMAESIRTVTNTANQYGISAQQAVQQLAQNTSTLENSYGMTGATATALAGGETSAALSMGRLGQGISFAGMSAQGPQRQQAAMLNMTYPQFRAKTQTDPMFAARANDMLITRNTSQYTSGANKEKLDAAIQSVGGIDALRKDPNLAQKVAIDMERQGVDLSQIAPTLQQAGVTGVKMDNPEQAGGVMINEYAQNGESQQNGTRTSIAQTQQRAVTDADKKWLNTDSRSFLQQAKDAFMKGFVGDGSTDFSSSDTPEMANKGAEQASGQIDPYIDNLIAPQNGIGSDPNVGVKVKTKQGEKVVPLQTALKSFRSQLADGSATIVGGSKDGQSAKQIMGGQIEDNYKGPDSTQADAPSDGVSVDDWKSQHNDPSSQDSGGGGSTNVTVTAGPQLQNWFNFYTGNGGTTQGGAATGTPPNPGGTPTVNGGTP